MGKPGPKPKPSLQVVREGNPGHRPVREGVKVPRTPPAEPDWEGIFPVITPGPKPRMKRNPEDADAALAEYQLAVEAWMRTREASDASDRCRAYAAAEWARIVPVLDHCAGLGVTDRTVLVDYCVCAARLDLVEHHITLQGLITQGQKGPVRNPLTTIAGQYRQQIARYVGELGLSPSARGRLSPPEGDPDDDDVFD